MADGMLSLSWNNHKATFCHILSTLREKEKYTDVTVACEGKFYQVHKLVLSTCSEYFEKIFENTPCKHPVIVLKDIAWDELEALLSYMYDGVVSVAQNDLARLIKAAEVLKIKGLAVPDEPPPSRNDVSPRKSAQRSASDDRTSPHPKRRRREENLNYGARNSPRSSPVRVSSRVSDSEPSRTESRWKENTDRPLDDRLNQSAPSTSTSPKPIEVIVDESLVKEEVEDTTDNQDDVMDYGGSLGSDSRLDGSIGEDDTSGQMLPNKFESDQGSQEDTGQQQQPLPDSVVEALAGPSGMQGWLGGCDVPGGFSGMEGYSGDSSQDLHPSQQGAASGAQSGTHQMVNWPDAERSAAGTEQDMVGDKVYQCPYCTFATSFSHIIEAHIANHGSEKYFFCSFCDYKANRKAVLKEHIYSRHTGEKPIKCPHCSFSTARRSVLTVHLRMHSGEKPYACSLCPYRSPQKSNLNTHMLKHKTNM